MLIGLASYLCMQCRWNQFEIFARCNTRLVETSSAHVTSLDFGGMAAPHVGMASPTNLAARGHTLIQILEGLGAARARREYPVNTRASTIYVGNSDRAVVRALLNHP